MPIVSVTDSATELFDAHPFTDGENDRYVSVHIENKSPNPVYIDTVSTVTADEETTGGYELAGSDATIEVTLQGNQKLYGICATIHSPEKIAVLGPT